MNIQTNDYVKSLVVEMKDILEKEIDIHLKNSHDQIYREVVKNWEWLIDSNKDWKWWWWKDNAWWNDIHCDKCIEIWEKYDMDIDPLDDQRRYYLNR